MKDYTLEDLQMEKVYAEATGKISIWEEEISVDINYSTILTKLIQEAGRWCEYYASDLFISWKQVEKFLVQKDELCLRKKFIFGMRESGVDHAEWVLSHMNRDGTSYYYRAIWCLEVEVDVDDITMKLGKVIL